MRFTKKQVQELRSRDLGRFRFGRKLCFLIGLTLGLVIGLGTSYFLSVYAVILLPR